MRMYFILLFLEFGLIPLADAREISLNQKFFRRLQPTEPKQLKVMLSNYLGVWEL